MQKGELPLPWEQESTPIWKTPYLISSYLQIFLNTFATLYIIKITYAIIQVIRKDIDYQIENEANDVLFEIEMCRNNYVANNCQPGQALPALMEQCSEWKNCMTRDPYSRIAYSSLGANILGSLFNALFEPIGFKSFLFLIAFAVACYLVNFSCGFVRAKSYYGLVDNNDRSPGSQLALIHRNE
ncbi:unnamed protein product [Ambrosiozyma monospora]|uniref:Unnamed protein product n=1 Tax=Ambrosiozyma monospora TaxID=43982 RepID=A0ACB5T5U1_AMBMO|nr:unnamed protein product [Ambrosiozyma monospora]